MDTLDLSRTSINELFTDLLRQKRGFKYLLTTKVTLKINDRYFIENSFEELINGIDQWISESPGWIIDKVESFYINIANYEPLSGSSYIPLHKKLNNPMKGLINIKNKDLKCFMWCPIRLINPTNNHPERMYKQDKKISSALDCSGIDFPMTTHDYELIGNRFNLNVNVFGYENKFYPLYISKKSNTQVLNVLLITNEKSQIMYLLKILTD